MGIDKHPLHRIALTTMTIPTSNAATIIAIPVMRYCSCSKNISAATIIAIPTMWYCSCSKNVNILITQQIAILFFLSDTHCYPALELHFFQKKTISLHHRLHYLLNSHVFASISVLIIVYAKPYFHH